MKTVVKLNSVKVGLETNPRKDSEITTKVRPLTAKSLPEIRDKMAVARAHQGHNGCEFV